MKIKKCVSGEYSSCEIVGTMTNFAIKIKDGSEIKVITKRVDGCWYPVGTQMNSVCGYVEWPDDDTRSDVEINSQ
jgi:hypothetical protein